MPNRLNNWTYNDVIKILRAQHFQLQHTRGSHYYYVGIVNGKMRQVCVPYHGKIAFKPRTVKGMMLQSGLSESIWGMD
jgi:predicted RNA binding protein YcfA (HicA-like mRNA interferase family)